MSDTPTPSQPIEPNPNGRAPGGRFAPGHTYSRGPHKTMMAEMRRKILEAESVERVREVVDEMRNLALSGDTSAARIYLDVVLGKATQDIEVSGPGGSALGLDFVRLEATILGAVEPFGPDVRFALAAALRGLVIDAGRVDEADETA